jgi:hypothetical protein
MRCSTIRRGLSYLPLRFAIAAGSGCGSSSSVTAGPSPLKCAVTLSAVDAVAGSGGAAKLAVTTQPECAWTAASQVAWITGLSPGSGQGSGDITFTVTANPAPSFRTGEVVVNTERARVEQAAAACRFSINPAGDMHTELGYVFGGLSRELSFATAVTAVARRDVTVIGALVGRRFVSVGRLADVTAAHPRLAGVDTIRLTAVPQPLTRLVAVGGVKWNLESTWLIIGHVMRPLTSGGLNATWVPTVTVDYSFGR